MIGIFLCCNRRAAVWCIADNIGHILYRHRLMLRRRFGWRWICPNVPKPYSWICRRHDHAITGERNE
jgi:hypothetical protein